MAKTEFLCISLDRSASVDLAETKPVLRIRGKTYQSSCFELKDTLAGVDNSICFILKVALEGADTWPAAIMIDNMLLIENHGSSPFNNNLSQL
jgi:hypothetical protein